MPSVETYLARLPTIVNGFRCGLRFDMLWIPRECKFVQGLNDLLSKCYGRVEFRKGMKKEEKARSPYALI